MKKISFTLFAFFLQFIFIFNAQAFQTGTIRGTVVDAVTGHPLPGANIFVLESEPSLGTASNLQGVFVIKGIPAGRHDIKISFVGYRPVIRSEIRVTSAQEVVLKVEMEQHIFEGKQLIVTPDRDKAQPVNDMAFVSTRSFTVEETRRYAGGLDDPARMAAAFAGVTSAGGIQQNALAIRGNAPKSVQWRLQGIKNPTPNHFGGLSVMGGGGLTIFSAELLADSDFMTSAFPAQYGNALAGIFDMKFRSGNPAQREYAAQIGLNGLELAAEGPFQKNGSSTYLFNYRYSTLALLMPILPTEGSISYQDLSFSLNFNTTYAGHFNVWGIGGLDGQTMEANKNPKEWEYELWDRIKSDMNMGMGAAGITHQIILGSNSVLKSTLATTINHLQLNHQRLNDDVHLEPNLSIESNKGTIVAKLQLDHRFGKRQVNRSGVSIRHLYYNIDVSAAANDEPPLQTYVNGTGSSRLVQAYTQSRFNLWPTLSLQAGLHAQWFALNDEILVEPRVGMEWKLNDQSTINLGYGLHSQLEDLRIYFAQANGAYPNKNLKLAKAHHFVAGYNINVGKNYRLKLEAYYQKLFDVPVIAESSFSMLNFLQDWTFNEALVNQGEGHNYGVEITWERFFNDGYYYLFTGTIYNSRYRDGNGVWHNTRFDQGFAFNLLGGKEFTWNKGKNVLGLNAGLSYMGGRRYSPIDQQASRISQEVEYFTKDAFEKQFPNRFIADLTVTYRINHNHYSSVWALQVKNLLFEKYRSHDYNFKTTRVELVEEGAPLPVLSYKIEF